MRSSIGVCKSGGIISIADKKADHENCMSSTTKLVQHSIKQKMSMQQLIRTNFVSRPRMSKGGNETQSPRLAESAYWKAHWLKLRCLSLGAESKISTEGPNGTSIVQDLNYISNNWDEDDFDNNYQDPIHNDSSKEKSHFDPKIVLF